MNRQIILENNVRRAYYSNVPGINDKRIWKGIVRPNDRGIIMNITVTNDPPLFVDLDGTLIETDTLIVSLRQLMFRRPWVLLVLPFYVLRSRAAFKARLSRSVTIDPEGLPYRAEILAFLREEKLRGRALILATAAHSRIGESVARHLNIFDAVIASDDSHNVKGTAKLAVILDHVSGGSFDYMGDSTADLPIFRRAREAILVHPSSRLLERTRATCRVGRVFR